MILRASIWSFDGGAASVIIMEVTGPDFREDHPARHRINVKGYLKHSLNWVRGLYVRLFSWGFPEGARSVPCPPCMFWTFFDASIYIYIYCLSVYIVYLFIHFYLTNSAYLYQICFVFLNQLMFSETLGHVVFSKTLFFVVLLECQLSRTVLQDMPISLRQVTVEEDTATWSTAVVQR